MIFVTVGTHTKGFERLVKGADEFASICSERIIIQRGSTTYSPIHAESFQWATSNRIGDFIEEARIVISHAGAGTLIQVLLFRKPLVVVPRLRKFKEAMDDHQTQLATALAEQKKVVMVMQPDGENLLRAAEQAVVLRYESFRNMNLCGALQEQLARWEEK